MGESKTLYIDYSLCIGCESCEAVCSYLHGSPRIHMARTSGGIMLPVHCHHCLNPGCMRACTVNAFRKDEDGAVILDPQGCVGCMVCLSVCPFSAVSHVGSQQPVTKCDLCAERRRESMTPACVEACPCGAILYGTRQDIERELRRRVAEAIVLAQTHPEDGQADVGLRQLRKAASLDE